MTTDLYAECEDCFDEVHPLNLCKCETCGQPVCDECWPDHEEQCQPGC